MVNIGFYLSFASSLILNSCKFCLDTDHLFHNLLKMSNFVEFFIVSVPLPQSFLSTHMYATGINYNPPTWYPTQFVPIKYPCKNCGKQYKYNQNLKRHLKYECGKPPTLKCSKCEYMTFYKYDLFNHAIRKHPDDYLQIRNDFVATKP